VQQSLQFLVLFIVDDVKFCALCADADGDTAEKLKDVDPAERVNSFSRTFVDEVRKGFQKIKQTKND